MLVSNTFSKYQGSKELASNYTFDTFPVKTSKFETHENYNLTSGQEIRFHGTMEWIHYQTETTLVLAKFGIHDVNTYRV